VVAGSATASPIDSFTIALPAPGGNVTTGATLSFQNANIQNINGGSSAPGGTGSAVPGAVSPTGLTATLTNATQASISQVLTFGGATFTPVNPFTYTTALNSVTFNGTYQLTSDPNNIFHIATAGRIFDVVVSAQGTPLTVTGPTFAGQNVSASASFTGRNGDDRAPPIFTPEPATMATFGLIALFGGFAARRKLRKADATVAA